MTYDKFSNLSRCVALYAPQKSHAELVKFKISTTKNLMLKPSLHLLIIYVTEYFTSE